MASISEMEPHTGLKRLGDSDRWEATFDLVPLTSRGPLYADDVPDDVLNVVIVNDLAEHDLEAEVETLHNSGNGWPEVRVQGTIEAVLWLLNQTNELTDAEFSEVIAEAHAGDPPSELWGVPLCPCRNPLPIAHPVPTAETDALVAEIEAEVLETLEHRLHALEFAHPIVPQMGTVRVHLAERLRALATDVETTPSPND